MLQFPSNSSWLGLHIMNKHKSTSIFKLGDKHCEVGSLSLPSTSTTWRPVLLWSSLKPTPSQGFPCAVTSLALAYLSYFCIVRRRHGNGLQQKQPNESRMNLVQKVSRWDLGSCGTPDTDVVKVSENLLKRINERVELDIGPTSPWRYYNIWYKVMNHIARRSCATCCQAANIKAISCGLLGPLNSHCKSTAQVSRSS